MTDCRTIAGRFAFVLLLMPALVNGQNLKALTWESLGPDGGYLSDIAQNPVNGDLFAVTYGYPARIYKSTNNGDTWQKISEIQNYVNELLVDPQQPATMYASQSGLYASSGVWKSTDGGVVWVQKGFPGLQDNYYNVSEFVIDRLDSKKLFVSGYCYSYNPTVSNYRTYVAKSTDSGESWSIREFTNITSEEFYAFCVEPDPSDANIMYVGGYSYVPPGLGFGRFFRTTDNGTSWTNTGYIIQGYVYDILADINSSGKVLAITGSGVYQSTDKGTTWVRASSDVYGSRFLRDPKNSSTLYAYGNGLACCRSTDAGGTWTSLNVGLSGGNTNGLLIHPFASGTLFTATRAGFFRSTNGGLDWTSSNRGIIASDVPTLHCLPTSPKTLYISFMYNGFYRTSNALGKGAPASIPGVTWEKMPEYTYCEGIIHMEVSPTDPKVIYIQEGAG
jgi:photosystem II stability/assembly factor-like uncharacterized protein